MRHTATFFAAPGVVWLAGILLAGLTSCGGAEAAPDANLTDEAANEGAEKPPPPPPPPVDGAAPAGDSAAADTPVDAATAAPGLSPEQPAAPAAGATTPTAAPAPAAEAEAKAPATMIKRASSPAEIALQEGLTYLNNRNYFDARQRYLNATKADPKSATAWYNLALIQWREGDSVESVANLEKAIEVNPTYSRAVVLLAVIQIRKGNQPAAMEAVSRSLLQRPTDVMLLGAKAMVQASMKDYRQALDTAVAALKLDFQNPELLRIMGEIYLGLNREGLALLSLNKAYDYYTSAAAKAATPTPEGQAAKSKYDERRAQGSDGLAGIDAEAIGREEGLAHIYYLYGKIALEKERYEEARRHFLKAVEYRPDYFEAWNNLGVTWIVAKKSTEAVEAFTKALELQPQSFDARVNLGNAFRIGDTADRADQAKKQYETAMKLNPSHPAPYFNMGILYLENKSLSTDQIKRFDVAKDYFGQYRQLGGSGPRGQKDPVEDYINEANGLQKIARDQRKAEAEAAKFAEEERIEREKQAAIDAEKKRIEDEKKQLEEAARLSATPTPTSEPAPPPADDRTPPPAAPPATGEPGSAPPPPPPGGDAAAARR